MSIPLSNELFTKKDEKKDEKKYHIKGDIMNENYYFDDDHYSHFEQPWTLNLNANYAYTRNTLSRFGTKVATAAPPSGARPRHKNQTKSGFESTWRGIIRSPCGRYL